MRSERLQAVVFATRHEVEAMRILPMLGLMRQALQLRTDERYASAAEAKISDALDALQSLAAAPSDGWIRSERNLLDELGLSAALGSQLLQRVEQVLERTKEGATFDAVAEIGAIEVELHVALKRLAVLIAGLGFAGWN